MVPGPRSSSFFFFLYRYARTIFHVCAARSLARSVFLPPIPYNESSRLMLHAFFSLISHFSFLVLRPSLHHIPPIIAAFLPLFPFQPPSFSSPSFHAESPSGSSRPSVPPSVHIHAFPVPLSLYHISGIVIVIVIVIVHLFCQVLHSSASYFIYHPFISSVASVQYLLLRYYNRSLQFITDIYTLHTP